MKPWEVWSYQPQNWPQPHPCVIVSAAGRVANKPDINVLLCASQQATRDALPHEVILDQADGLNWPTLCKCDLLHLVAKSALKNRRGQVTVERRRAIIASINRSNEWL